VYKKNISLQKHQKHKGCFSKLQLHQLQCAWDYIILEAHTSF